MKTSMTKILSSVLLFLFFVFGCQPEQKIEPGEGFIQVTGGKVWYRVVGEGEKTPLLLLHGGPGVPSYYLNPLANLADERPVIFLDQLGCGRSDRIQDTSLMTVENYVEQLEQFRKALGLEEYYLYGQSWGTMLGVDYYLKYPKGIKALILSSPALDIDLWTNDAQVLISTLPDSIQDIINTSIENESYDSPEFHEAMNLYYQNFVARKLPWDANIDSAFAGMGENVYSYMWGPSEFRATGNLKNYDRTEQLGDIKVPTLFVCGEFDEARPETVKYYQSLVPNAKFTMIEDAAHITMHDNPGKDLQVIRDFLSELENH